MKLYSKDGVEMMSVKSIELGDDKIIVRGKMMRTMASTIFVGPEDIAAGVRLMSLKTILSLPVLLIKGFLRSGRKREPEASGVDKSKSA